MNETTTDSAAQSNAKLESALYLARHKIQVVPAYHIRANDGFCSCDERGACTSAGKHPIWSEWQRRGTTNPAEIRKAWKEHPRANVYAVCGAISDLLVLDWDGDTEDGLRRLEEMLGPLPVAPRVNSGTPGHFHLWFKHTPGLINRVKVDGIDIRTEGGGVVAPGSTNGNGQYRWGRSLDDLERPRLPAPWIRHFPKSRPYVANDAPEESGNGAGGGESFNADEASQGTIDLAEVEEMLPFIDPGPHDIWRDVGMALQDAFGKEGKPLWDAWSKGPEGKKCKKFDQREQDRQWPSFTAGGGIGIGTVYKLATDAGWQRKSKDKAHSYRRTTTERKEAPKADTLGAAGLRPLNLVSMLELKVPQREYLLSPVLRTRDLAMVHAWRGIGKTHVALGVAYAIASGGEFLRWKADRPHRVLYVDGELPSEDLQERLGLLVTSHPDKPAQSDFLQIITPDAQERSIGNLIRPDAQGLLTDYLCEQGIEVLIIDSISTLCRGGGAENDRESFLPMQDWALELRRKGIAVVFIHHDGKGEKQRGSSGKEDTMDVVIHLTRPSDYTAESGASFEVHFEKARGLYGDAVKPFECRLSVQCEQMTWTMKDVEDAHMMRAVEMFLTGAKVPEIAEALKLHRATIYRLKQKAVAQGLLNE